MNRKQMTGAISLAAIGMFAILGSGSKSAKAQNPNPGDVMTVDVAVDMSTFNFVPVGGDSMSPNRGTAFIVNGKIYPGGTLPSGAAGNSPDQPGSIGEWICKGFLTADLAAQLSGATKIGFDTTQMFLFDGDGQAVWTEGLEAALGPAGPGTITNRIALGGTGRFRGYAGPVVQQSLGTNASGAPNIRIHFRAR